MMAAELSLLWPEWGHAMASAATAAALCALFLFFALRSSALRQHFGSARREWTPDRHRPKAGTPTFGGVAMICSSAVAFVLWTPHKPWAADGDTVAVALWWGFVLVHAVLGAYDDRCKRRQRRGLSIRKKLAIQVPVTLAFLWALMRLSPAHVPGVDLFGYAIFLGEIGALLLGLMWVIFLVNAVNLTDGLDGLAAGNAVVVWAGLLALLLLWPSLTTTVAKVPVAVVVAAAGWMGACAGFLVFNRPKAQVFMGDTGSLALGAALVVTALMAGRESWVSLLSLVFVLEGLSVVVQISAVRIWGRRVFRMSPIHHHFELGGWSEMRVLSVSVMVSLVMMMVVLAWAGG